MRSFTCEACAIELADGVDYSWCPRCGGSVTPSGIAAPLGDTVPTPSRVARWLLGTLVVVQTLFALADPRGFPYLGPLIVVALVAALPGVIATIIFVPAIRTLVDERIRILHGLEHATIHVLEQRGIAVHSGVTLRVRGRGMFDLAFVNDGRNGDRSVVIRSAAIEAIRRVATGERALAFHHRCGTSDLVGMLVVSVAVAGAVVIALASHVAYGYAFAGIVVAVAVARWCTRWLGLAAQRAFTVSAHFASARVDAVEREVSPRGDLIYYAVHATVQPITGREVAEPI